MEDKLQYNNMLLGLLSPFANQKLINFISIAVYCGKLPLICVKELFSHICSFLFLQSLVFLPLDDFHLRASTAIIFHVDLDSGLPYRLTLF